MRRVTPLSTSGRLSTFESFAQHGACCRALAAKNMSVVKAFFEFCHANEWTPRNPARMVKNQRGQHNDPRSEQKLPFSDEELKRMYDACDTKYGKRKIQLSKAT